MTFHTHHRCAVSVVDCEFKAAMLREELTQRGVSAASFTISVRPSRVCGHWIVVFTHLAKRCVLELDGEQMDAVIQRLPAKTDVNRVLSEIINQDNAVAL